MLTRRSRRYGISSLIGAIFFVLVVFLVFSSTVLIFETFTNYATTFKQVNAQDLQNKNTALDIQDLAFGGYASTPTDETLTAVSSSGITPNFDPVQNMNFTNNMNGWTFSRGYELSLHNASVTNSPENVLPGLVVFTMVITNLDQATVYSLGTLITSVSLIVNPAWKVPSGPGTQQAPSCGGPTCWNAPVVSGNTITWTAANTAPGCTNGIAAAPAASDNGNTAVFYWSAVVPPTDGTYLHDISLTWETVNQASPQQCASASDEGTATITTTVVPSNQGGESTSTIVSQPLGTIPGGAFGGYDQTSSGIGSESGPGSVYMSFQPTFDGQPITTTLQSGSTVPDQLTTVMNFTTYFDLSAALDLSNLQNNCSGAGGHPETDCPVLSLGYSLDHLVSGAPALLFLSADLTYLGTPSTPADRTKSIINATGLDTTNSGWQMNETAFSLGAGGTNPIETVAYVLPAGQYELSVSVTATMFGTNPPSSDYPASLQMHFDDMGLVFKEAASSYCVDTAATGPAPCAPTTYYDAAVLPPSGPCPSGAQSCGLFSTLEVAGQTVTPSQIQSLQFDAELSLAAPGTVVTAYAYLENVQASPSGPAWVEIGQVSFNSSANIDATIPASIASSYLDSVGSLCKGLTGADPQGSACIRIYAVSAGNFGSIQINASLVVQTWQENQGTVLILNNGTQPVHIVSVYVSGANTPYGNATGGTAPLGTSGGGIWISGGETTAVQLGQAVNAECTTIPTSLKCFNWSTSQTYVVTVTTDQGVVFTETFVSP